MQKIQKFWNMRGIESTLHMKSGSMFLFQTNLSHSHKKMAFAKITAFEDNISWFKVKCFANFLVCFNISILWWWWHGRSVWRISTEKRTSKRWAKWLQYYIVSGKGRSLLRNYLYMYLFVCLFVYLFILIRTDLDCYVWCKF